MSDRIESGEVEAIRALLESGDDAHEVFEHADRAHAEQTLREVREVLGAGDDECVVEVARRRMQERNDARRDAIREAIEIVSAHGDCHEQWARYAQRQKERAGERVFVCRQIDDQLRALLPSEAAEVQP